MKIAIITDGNNQLGMGHVYQSMTLGNYLLEKMNSNDELFYITKSEANIIELLKTTHCSVFHYLNDDLIFEKLRTFKPDRIIFDKLDVAPELAKNIKENLDAKLIICTNLTEANKYADVTVMAGMGSNFKNIYSNKNGKVDFLGPKYWIMRPEFFKYSEQAIKTSRNIKNILLQFGGSDQANLSSIVLEKLLQINPQYNITIIVGNAFEYMDILNGVIDRYKELNAKVKILFNVKEVAHVMSENDLAFVSPGLSFFEALVVGVPVVCFHQNEFQKNAWMGSILTLDKTDVEQLPNILKEQKFIFPSDSFITSMEIGKGKDEFLNAILSDN
jgi:spore coat polysaccharide biosynthesis predicted glycosyltransferase SpsG